MQPHTRKLALALAALSMSPAAAAQTAGAEIVGLGHDATVYIAAADATPRERLAADARCDGTADEVTLQAALDALGPRGGSVALSSGTFLLDAALRLRGRVRLVGQGTATTLRATPAFVSGEGILDGGWTGVGPVPLELATVANMTLDGNRWNGALTRGIHLDIRSKNGFRFGSPDAFMSIRDVLIANTASHGLHVEGSHCRATRVQGVRVWNADGHGVLIDSPDGHYTDCDTGSSGLDGIAVRGANNHFATCKAWYSDGAGFAIEAVRATFVGCTAQDNETHGFAIRAGMATLSGCHADSNSFAGTGTPDVNRGVYDGFHIASSNVVLSACFAYDKNEGGRGSNQRYGVFVDGARARLNLQVNCGNAGTHDNFTGRIGGVLTGSDNLIAVTGQ